MRPNELDCVQPLRMFSAPGLRLCEGVYAEPGEIPAQPHEWATLCLTIDGGYQVDWRGARVDCGPASLVFHPPGDVYGARILDSGSRCLTVGIDPSILDDTNGLADASRVLETKERVVMAQKTLTTLQQAWESAMPRLSAQEQRLGITLVRELAAGEPLSAPQLARAAQLSPSETQAMLRESALTPFIQAEYVDGESRVKGFFGLSTSPTAHRFEIGGRATLWTWCAQDSLFLPELLGETARIESKDPETGKLVRLTTSPERIETVEANDVVVSMVRADAADLSSYARVIATACHFIFFFASRASGERWVAAHPHTALLSLDDAFALAERQNATVFGEELARRAQAT